MAGAEVMARRSRERGLSPLNMHPPSDLAGLEGWSSSIVGVTDKSLQTKTASDK